MNFTALVAGNFSESFINCFTFGYDWWTKTVSDYYAFGSTTDFVLAFVFKQLGNAGTFRDIIDKIETAEQNQYYESIAFQYGRLLRKALLDIEPIATESLMASIGINEETAPEFLENYQKMKKVVDATGEKVAAQARLWL